MTTPADAPPNCAGYVWGQGGMGRIACSRHGYAEHNGQWYCKMHHPPTIADRALARQRKENGERAANEERKARGQRYRDALGMGVPHWHTPIGGSLKGQGWTGGVVLTEEETIALLARLGESIETPAPMNRYSPHYDPDEQRVRMGLDAEGGWVHINSVDARTVKALRRRIAELENPRVGPDA